MKFKFRLVTPEKVLLESEVNSLTCVTELGEITVLPNHIPLVANLVPGELKVVDTDVETFVAISGGVIEIRPGNDVVVLADVAEAAEEIDVQRAEAARERAKIVMTEQILSDEEYAQTAATLEKSLARLKVARRRRSRTHISENIS